MYYNYWYAKLINMEIIMILLTFGRLVAVVHLPSASDAVAAPAC